MEDKERLKQALSDRYLIEREIGSGGMATVYLAQDLRHDRKVAVKVLRPELGAVMGTARFLAEIRTTANLSHPHILPLHDSGEADGLLFYVMPLVEGENLRERLDREGQLPVEEALRIAGHVADALDSAHRHGVIHRDLKPANVLFQEGEPVVADFGIALAVSAAGEGRLTETGLSLGTPYYMSPEQAAGDQTPTAASDVYSLGCVIYEMLTGDPPHTGSSAQAILGKILLGEVTRPSKLRRTIPANVEGALLKALERLPADRFGSAAELAAALRDKEFRHGVGVGAGAAGGPWKGLAAGLGVVAVLALVAAVTGFFGPDPPQPQLLWIHPPGEGIFPEWGRYVALAPDGSSMVYRDTVGLGAGWQLWIKESGSEDGRPLSGTFGARDVVWSPDGDWIAYVVGTDLFKRSVYSSSTMRLLEGMDDEVVALNWMADGTILCEQEGHTLVRISEDRGAPPDTVFDFTGFGLRWVYGLPNEEAALVVTSGEMLLWVVDLRADTAWVLRDNVARAWFAPTGHVVYVRTDGAVLAAPFDLKTLELGTQHVSLFEGVSTGSNIADMVMGRDGTVLFIRGGPSGRDFELVWVDREGREESIHPALKGDLHFPALSPDGARVAFQDDTKGSSEIWIHEFDRGSTYMLTSEGGVLPTWGPDHGSVTFSSNRGGDNDLWMRRADGSGETQLLMDFDRSLVEAVWSPDYSWLVSGTSSGGSTLGDILAWQPGKDTVPIPLVETELLEAAPALSPNGRFLAYTTYESDEYQVYVRPFPNVGGGRHQVSIERGIEPVWGKSGKELFYRKSEYGDLVAVDVETADSFRIGEEHLLFPAGQYMANPLHSEYDVTPDGQKFIMLRPLPVADPTQEPRMILIQNWFTELEERLGRGR